MKGKAIDLNYLEAVLSVWQKYLEVCMKNLKKTAVKARGRE